MFRSLLIAGAASMALLPASRASAQLYLSPNFDNLDPNGNETYGLLDDANGGSSLYQGATWGTYTGIVSQSWYDSSYGNTVIFPSFGVAATNWATTSAVTLTLSDPATSFAGEFATWAEDDTFGPSSATKVTVEGLNSLYQSVGSETLYLEPNFQWLNVAFTSQAAYIWILNDGSGEWLMDVPEPASYALLCTALSSLLVLRRRQASPLV